MVSPGELRMLTELSDGEGEFTPETGPGGSIDYPTAERLLDDRDPAVVDVLERFGARGVLDGEFVSKVYSCPECSAQGMQYTTACPACESAHAIETTVVEHRACGASAPESHFEREDGHVCPECETRVREDDLERTERYVCKECNEVFETPEHRLWCRDCLYMFPPEETIERALYRYRITDDGREWAERHRLARETAADTLEERRFEVSVDTTVEGEGTTYPVHVFAKDPLLGERRVVAIAERPTGESVAAFRDLAREVNAHPIVVTTTGAVSEEVATLAESADLTLLSARPDGSLDSQYDVAEGTPRGQSLFQRLTSAMDVPAWKGQ
jgi:Thaumarchaeal output domain 1